MSGVRGGGQQTFPVTRGTDLPASWGCESKGILRGFSKFQDPDSCVPRQEGD